MNAAALDKEKLQKLFYFSLKKTGNPHDAVVKKRYARWCKAKRIKSSRYEIDDIHDYVEISDGSSVEDNILYNEDIELLRRELALMAKDYRENVYNKNLSFIIFAATSGARFELSIFI